MSRRKSPSTAVDSLTDFALTGRITAPQMRCVLCQHTPCDCPPFGTPGHRSLITRRHRH